MTFNHNIGGHAFTERGGKCLKCGTTWANYTDTDSKTYQRPCPGKKPEPSERMSIPDDDE